MSVDDIVAFDAADANSSVCPQVKTGLDIDAVALLPLEQNVAVNLPTLSLARSGTGHWTVVHTVYTYQCVHCVQCVH
jgi:hypothetical protein